MIEVARIEAAERKLLTKLPEMVGALALPELIVPYTVRREKYRVSAEGYELWTLKGNVADLEPDEQLDSLAPAEYSYTAIPEPHTPHCVCLDSRDAIGLAGEGHLIAFASAGINHVTGSLYVTQIQGTHSDATNPTAMRYRRGIRWPETIVNAWAVIGRELGLEIIEIERNPGASTKTAEQQLRGQRLAKRHQETARSLGFETIGADWRKDLNSFNLRKLSRPGPLPGQET